MYVDNNTVQRGPRTFLSNNGHSGHGEGLGYTHTSSLGTYVARCARTNGTSLVTCVSFLFVLLELV